MAKKTLKNLTFCHFAPFLIVFLAITSAFFNIFAC